MTKLIVSLFFATFSYCSFATDLDPAKAQGLINAFRTCGIPGVVSGTTRSYSFDLTCLRADNMGIDSTDPSYALSSYNCDVGAGKLAYAKAQVLFEASLNAFGSSTADGKTMTGAKNVQCVLQIDTAAPEQRFVCTKD